MAYPAAMYNRTQWRPRARRAAPDSANVSNQGGGDESTTSPGAPNVRRATVLATGLQPVLSIVAEPSTASRRAVGEQEEGGQRHAPEDGDHNGHW